MIDQAPQTPGGRRRARRPPSSLRPPTPALVALGSLGAVLSLAGGASAQSTACGLALAVTAVLAGTVPATAAVVAWLVCAWSLLYGAGIDLPVYLLVGVPLWTVARHSTPRWVIAAATAAAAGGMLAAAYALTAPVPVRLLVGPFRPFRWTLSVASWSEALLLAFPVWLMAALCLGLGLLSRGMEAGRRSRDAWEASQARSRMLDAQNELAEERTRISREMHDIVGHSLSVMIAQADGGRYAAGNDPQAAVRALEAIAQTGRDALSDMRGIVRVLRDGPEDETVQLKPTAHVRDIERLIEETRQAGLDVTLVRVGQPRYLPPGVGATLYRVTQEALTNVLKHAGPNVAVSVAERWTDTRIAITVSDDGRGAAAPSDGTGHGLLGMRERAEMLGGIFRAGPGTAGGFTVHVSVPLPSARERLGAPSPAPPVGQPPAARASQGQGQHQGNGQHQGQRERQREGQRQRQGQREGRGEEKSRHGTYSRAGG
ncbi:MAG: sensor histidine kinase [Bifidobacteriaceae bacterium]|nr:sensor histidine kinase [Bifidobacteriaceae bacterium]